MRVAVLKLPGVESADVSITKASADIRLKADNRITIPELREIIRKNGYPTRDAQIVARGTIVDRSGKAAFDLLNGTIVELVADPKNVGAFEQVEALRREARHEIVELTGVSRVSGKHTETVTVTGVGPPK